MLRVVGNNTFLIAVIEVDIKLGNANLFQQLQLLDVLLGFAQHTKTFNDIRGDKIQVGIVTLTVFRVVIAFSIFNVRSQTLRNLR